MTKWILGAAAAALIALGGGTAQAQTPIAGLTESQYPYQRWVEEAQISTPSTAITVTEEACPTEEFGPVGACFDPDNNTIYMNVPALTAWGWWPRQVFYHEMGHAIEPSLDPPERHEYRALRGHTRRAWLGVRGLQELFAWDYSSCALGQSFRKWLSDTVYPYSEATCQFIDQAAA